MKPIAILGGGLSGLACAYYLQKKNTPFTLYEKSSFGGKIQSIRKHSSILEQGPFSIRYQQGRTNILELIKTLNLKEKLQIADKGANKKHLFYQGKLIMTPQSFYQMLFFPIRPHLLSIFRKDFFLQPSYQQDDSVYNWICRHRLNSLLPLFDAFFKGVWASSLKETSAQITLPKLFEISSQKGSLIKNLHLIKKRFNEPSKHQQLHNLLKQTNSFSFQGGLHTLIEAMKQYISPFNIKQEEIIDIEFENGKCSVTTPQGQFPHSQIISTLPAPEISKILLNSDSSTNSLALAQTLNNIQYQTIYLHHFITSPNTPLPQSFGYLVPSSEQSVINGVIFAHESFPQNYSHKVLTLFTSTPDKDKVLKELFYQIKQTFKLIDNNFNIIPKAIPLFHVNYKKTIDKIEKSTQKSALKISGSFISKPSINDILDYSKKLINSLI